MVKSKIQRKLSIIYANFVRDFMILKKNIGFKCAVLMGLFFFKMAYALEFYVHSGRENHHNFAILNVVDDKPFACEEEYDRNSEVKEILCAFNATLLSRFERSETLFFSISAVALEENGKQRFYLKITPKADKKMKLYNTEFNLSHNTPVPIERNTHSKRWQILGYEGEIPFLNDKPSYGINFPLQFDNTPQLGVLDTQIRPMANNVGRDKDYFLSAQSFMGRKSYEEALSVVEEMLGLYPDTIFKRDILFLKLEALDRLNSTENYEEIITLGKAWIDAYPTDINVAQALYIMARNYAKMKFFDEAKYYYERLFNEHKGNKYELLARLDYGENLYSRGDRRVVLEMYDSVLAQTDDLEVASLASILLADYYRKAENMEMANKYIEDVLRANPSFFLGDIPKYYNLMQEWAEFGIYEAPARVVEVAFKSLPDRSIPLYLPILKDMAIWFDKAGNFEKAHFYYQQLLKESPSEAEVAMIKDLDNKLLLHASEDNATKRLEHYDYILENYKGKDEERIALEKKAQTFYDLGDYLSIFEMRDVIEEKLGENHKVLMDSLKELVRDGLGKKDCKIVAYYASLYEIPLETSEEFFEVFSCLYTEKQYTPALKIAKNGAQNAENVKEKEKWLYYIAWIEYLQYNYPKASLAARDVLKLLSDESYNDSAWVLFMALHKQGNKKEAFKMLPILEEKLENDNKMIEVYYVFLQDSLERKDDIAIKIYANKVLELQKLHQRFEYSPLVELAMAEALSRERNFTQSLAVLESAETYSKDNEERIQIFYLQGYLHNKLGNLDKSIESYEKCASIEVQSPWKNLCIDAKQLIKKE